MKKLTSIILILFLSLLSSPSWSETLVCKYTGFNCPEIDDFEELIQVDGLFYKKFTNTPFTGKVIGGEKQGSLKDGKKVGEWVEYHDNGQLEKKVEYKDGQLEGESVGYFRNGQLWWKGQNKDGKIKGEWIYYLIDGTVAWKKTF